MFHDGISTELIFLWKFGHEILSSAIHQLGEIQKSIDREIKVAVTYIYFGVKCYVRITLKNDKLMS